jgi:hypothetical protein
MIMQRLLALENWQWQQQPTNTNNNEEGSENCNIGVTNSRAIISLHYFTPGSPSTTTTATTTTFPFPIVLLQQHLHSWVGGLLLLKNNLPQLPKLLLRVCCMMSAGPQANMRIFLLVHQCNGDAPCISMPPVPCNAPL